MKAWAVLAVAAAAVLSCSPNTTPTSNLPRSPLATAATPSTSPGASAAALPGTSPEASATPVASPGPTLTLSCTPAASYGLLISGGNLQVINTCGKVAATTSVTPSSV